jgi:hypothetical protein
LTNVQTSALISKQVNLFHPLWIEAITEHNMERREPKVSEYKAKRARLLGELGSLFESGKAPVSGSDLEKPGPVLPTPDETQALDISNYLDDPENKSPTGFIHAKTDKEIPRLQLIPDGSSDAQPDRGVDYNRPPGWNVGYPEERHKRKSSRRTRVLATGGLALVAASAAVAGLSANNGKTAKKSQPTVVTQSSSTAIKQPKAGPDIQTATYTTTSFVPSPPTLAEQQVFKRSSQIGHLKILKLTGSRIKSIDKSDSPKHTTTTASTSASTGGGPIETPTPTITPTTPASPNKSRSRSKSKHSSKTPHKNNSPTGGAGIKQKTTATKKKTGGAGLK